MGKDGKYHHRDDLCVIRRDLAEDQQTTALHGRLVALVDKYCTFENRHTGNYIVIHCLFALTDQIHPKKDGGHHHQGSYIQ